MYLSKEQQEYLEKAVDVDEYLSDSINLCNQIERYILKKEWYLERNEHLVRSIHDNAVENEISHRMILRDLRESSIMILRDLSESNI